MKRSDRSRNALALFRTGFRDTITAGKAYSSLKENGI
jgi:hypothetical protein